MKPYLVDVAVKTTIWTRLNVQRKQFEVIKKARPSTLLLVSDGGRNDEEWKLISQNRQMFEDEIDWDCTVYKLYEDENIGVWPMINRGHDFVWSHVDECIFLEDDDIPSLSLFLFCKEMLDKYRDDKRIGIVCAFNPLGVYNECPYDYFFTSVGTIWGIATWKNRVQESFKKNVTWGGYSLSRMKDNSDFYFYKEILGYQKDKKFNGHEATDEHYYEISRVAYHQLRIFPKVNLISNVGYMEGGGAHTENDLRLMPKGIRRLYSMETHEIKFPLKHPQCMVNDKIFNRRVNKMYGVDMPWVAAWRKIERMVLLIKYGKLWEWIRRKAKRV